MREVMEPFEPAPVPKTKAKESAWEHRLHPSLAGLTGLFHR
jgi:hypothetical protein